MRRHAELLSIALFVLLVAPGLAKAQCGPPPPPCCGHSPAIQGEDRLQYSGRALSKFEVSEGVLQSLGITRGQFLERLSEGLLTGRLLNRVIYSTSFVNRTILGSHRAGPGEAETAASEDGLVAVEQRRVYQMTRDRLQRETLAAAGVTIPRRA